MWIDNKAIIRYFNFSLTQVITWQILEIAVVAAYVSAYIMGSILVKNIFCVIRKLIVLNIELKIDLVYCRYLYSKWCPEDGIADEQTSTAV